MFGWFFTLADDTAGKNYLLVSKSDHKTTKTRKIPTKLLKQQKKRNTMKVTNVQCSAILVTGHTQI